MNYKAAIIAITLCAAILEANAQYAHYRRALSGGQRIIAAPAAYGGARYISGGLGIGGVRSAVYGQSVAPIAPLAQFGIAPVAHVAQVAPFAAVSPIAPFAASRQAVGPVSAAIITQRSVDYVNVPVPQDVIVPQTLIVDGSILPVNIEFRSQSSPVNVNQVHIPGPPGTVQQTRSEEEPDILVHEVVKPVIQEVRETITPYRTITQQIQPVQEVINTIIARGERQQVVAPALQQVVAARAAPALIAAAPALVAAPVQPIRTGVIAGQLPTFSAFRSVSPVVGQPLVFGGGLGIVGSRRVVGQPIVTSIKRA